MYSEFSDYAQKQYELIIRMIKEAQADQDNASPACKVTECILYTNVAQKLLEEEFIILDQSGRKIELDSTQEAILGTFYIVPPAKSQEMDTISLEGKDVAEEDMYSSDGTGYMDATKYDGIEKQKMPIGFDEQGNPIPFKEAFKERWKYVCEKCKYVWEILKKVFGFIMWFFKKVKMISDEIDRRELEKIRARREEQLQSQQLQMEQQNDSYEIPTSSIGQPARSQIVMTKNQKTKKRWPKFWDRA